MVVLSQKYGGPAESAAPLSMSKLLPSSLPSLRNESSPSMKIQQFSSPAYASQPGGAASYVRAS